MPLQTNLIAYSSHATEVKEWYYYPEPSTDSKSGGKAAGQSEDGRAGPITKDELRMYYAQNKVSNLCFQYLALLRDGVHKEALCILVL